MAHGEIEAGLGWTWDARRVGRAIRDPATEVVVAWRGERLAGFAIMSFADDTANLDLLGVHPSQRRQGVGRRLVTWLLDTCRGADIQRVSLQVRADNPGAQAFYTRLGFEVQETLPGYYRGRLDALRMVMRPSARPLEAGPRLRRPEDGDRIPAMTPDRSTEPRQAVAIIGGAVAGATLARMLADQGIEVVVIEQNKRRVYTDIADNYAYIAQSEWAVDYADQQNPGIAFHKTVEI